MQAEQHQPQRCGERGFTLIEIMVVVVILGLLATQVVPSLMESSDTADLRIAETGCKTVYDQLQNWKLRNKGAEPTIEALTTVDEKTGYAALENDPIDPWGNEYVIVRREVGRGYRVMSLGPDGVDGSEDDIFHPAKKEDS